MTLFTNVHNVTPQFGQAEYRIDLAIASPYNTGEDELGASVFLNFYKFLKEREIRSSDVAS